jgi:hypothetical protein
MTRGTLIPLLIAAVGFGATDRTLAAERKIAGMQVTSSDATARFMALGVSKSVVIDFPTDIQVADKGIAVVVVQSKRRVYIIGAALGQTNVYFFDADGQQIDALNIAVTGITLPAALEHYPFPANVVWIYNGINAQTLSCTPIMCIDVTKPGANQPPGTQNINITGSATAVAVTAGSK